MFGFKLSEYTPMHNTEFHFRDMHVYVNQLFKSHADADNRYVYRWNDKHTIKEHHHIHIFLWREGDDVGNVINMGRFINICNQITKHPVYIHIPKRHRGKAIEIKGILSDMYCDGRKLRYEIILENNTHVTNFLYHHLYGHGKKIPKALLSIRWDRRGYARPVFYDTDTNTTEEVFKRDALLDLPDEELTKLMKPQIIEEFKKKTPKGILESFKSDEDIWDYINKNGEWSVRIEEKKEEKENGNHK